MGRIWRVVGFGEDLEGSGVWGRRIWWVVEFGGGGKIWWVVGVRGRFWWMFCGIAIVISVVVVVAVSITTTP